MPSAKRFGCVGVLGDDGRSVAWDEQSIARHLDKNLVEMKVEDIMTLESQDGAADDACNERYGTAEPSQHSVLVVTDEEHKFPVGIVYSTTC